MRRSLLTSRTDPGIGIGTILIIGALLLVSVMPRPAASAGPEAGDRGLSGVWALAESLEVADNDDAAITEYSRFAFFCPDSTRAADAHERIAACREREGDLPASLEAEWTAIQLRQARLDSDALGATRARWFARAGNIGRAQIEWLFLAQRTQDRTVREVAWFELVCLHTQSSQWTAARAALAQCVGLRGEMGSDRRLAQADSLLVGAERQRVRSVRVARRLSTFVPGLGQAYGGSYGTALNALLVNAAGVTFLVRAIAERDAADMLLAGSFLERYYSGNRFRAGELTEVANAERDRRARDPILSILAAVASEHSTGAVGGLREKGSRRCASPRF